MVRKALPPISLTVPQKCFLDRRGYVIGDGISSGSFGAVYSATRYEEPSAVKVIAIDKLISKSQGTVNKCLPREIYLLKTLKHLNVIAVYDIYAIEKNLYIFMEKATGGDLDDFLFKNAATRGVFLPEGTCASYFFQVSQALAFMHSQGFSHRDIKGENVLLTGPKRELAKLADFGLARPIYDLQKGNQMNAKTWCGTMVFM